MMASITINDLPIEILSHIFSYVCIEKLVLSVRNVCSHWRIIIDNDTALWNAVTFIADIQTLGRYDLHFILSKVSMIRNVKVTTSFAVEFMLKVLIEYCPNIRKLEFCSAVNLTCENLKDIINLKRLESLTFGSSDINSNDIKLLGLCCNLKCLSLTGDMLQFENLLDGLTSGWCHLEALHLKSLKSYSCENDDLTKLLAVHKDTLKCLSVSSRKIDLLLLDRIRCCSQLRKLCIEWTTRQEATDLTNIMASLNFTDLTLVNYCGSAEMMLDVVTKCSCKNMRKLNFIFCRECDDQVVDTITKRFPLLTELKLEGSYGLTDKGLEHIGRLSLLTVLDISKCPLLTDEAVKYVSSSCLQLRHVAMRGLNITDNGVMHMSLCFNLQMLNLDECDELTGDTLLPLVERIEELTVLTLSRCESMDKFYISKLKICFPLLQLE